MRKCCTLGNVLGGLIRLCEPCAVGMPITPCNCLQRQHVKLSVNPHCCLHLVAASGLWAEGLGGTCCQGMCCSICRDTDREHSVPQACSSHIIKQAMAMR